MDSQNADHKSMVKLSAILLPRSVISGECTAPFQGNIIVEGYVSLIKMDIIDTVDLPMEV